MTKGVEKKHFSGFLVWNKLNEKKYFFTEEDFLDEINQLLMLLKSSFRIEPHLIIPGLCLKLNSSFLKKTDLKDNDLQLQIYDHFKK